jgi:hypothetical protein
MGRAVSKERLGDWVRFCSGPILFLAPLFPQRRATWPNGEWGIVLAVM